MAASLEFRLTGGASNSDPDDSLGGVMSDNTVSATSLNNLFDNVDASEATAGDTEYRMIDLYNAGDATATSVEIYISSQTTSNDTSLELGQDATNNPHTSGASLETLTDEDTAPASPVISFSAYTSASSLSLSDIPAGQAARIALKWIVDEGAGNTNSDACTIEAVFA